MKPARRIVSTLLAGAAVTLSSCGDSTPIGPAPGGPQVSAIGDFFHKLFDTVRLIDSCSSLSSLAVTQTIGKEGGVIVIGPDTLTIPPNALNKPVTISASLPDGYFVNMIVFRPDGLRFKKPATLSMGYSNCYSFQGLHLRVAQVTDDLQIIEYLQSRDHRNTKTVTGQVQHFSNYAIAW